MIFKLLPLNHEDHTEFISVSYILYFSTGKNVVFTVAFLYMYMALQVLCHEGVNLT